MKWHDWRLALYLAVAGLGWCVAVGVVLYIVPFGSTEITSGGVTSTGVAYTNAPVTTEGERLFEGSSLLGLWPLVLPAVLCALGALAAVRRHRWPLIIAMTLLALLLHQRLLDRPLLRPGGRAARAQRARLVAGRHPAR